MARGCFGIVEWVFLGRRDRMGEDQAQESGGISGSSACCILTLPPGWAALHRFLRGTK